MGKKLLKYMIIVVAFVLVGYNSVYFKKLDDVKAERNAKTFDAAAYAQNFWNKKLTPNLQNAVDVKALFPMLNSNPAQAFNSYSHALGIGNLRYFLIQGKASVATVGEDDITISLADLPGQQARIAIEFIFGNAVRDASGMINVNDFNNTMDFNNVSAEINKIIRAKVLPQLKRLKVGDKVTFIGAIELNKAHFTLAGIKVIPVAINSLN